MKELRSAAEAVQQNLNIPSLNGGAVSKLTEFIDRERASVNHEARPVVINALGCFLGECIIRSFGGHWHRDASGLVGVQIAGYTFTNPFSYVERQLVHGAAESVMVLFLSLPTRLAAAAVPRRRTWIPVPSRRTTSS
ncbi:hypothetical protein SAMN00120144_1208 [Hymenobacter roseosalivarius DSM 11622]|uniref:Uncharacterized protein n=1 Tax=Hymenobacter roseosalivarius DSM 11622 TaxID=645990 RepID=A0A1W1V4L8_9BACT|nr:hypothetical protein [Hymenobacter roseosalivarius]SMB88298.1 hypothetical protein SAMN00120144_1208 [Hymenobacter roseosalivarius DSM 11622]